MKRVVSIAALFAATTSASFAADITINDKITSDTTWTSDNTYILDGLIYVEDAVLTIEPGTVIKGIPDSNPNDDVDEFSALIIMRGSKIFAVGTPSDPIIFTSTDDVDPFNSTLDEQDVGRWAGVVILSDGLLNSAKVAIDANPDTADVELLEYPNILDHVEGIEPVPETEFGGTSNDGEGSGIFRYVSIRHGGAVLDPNNELNGLTLGGVNNNTTIEFVEIFANTDDGIEIFGGNVDIRFIAAVLGGDDGFDFDTGWLGRGQFLFGLGHRQNSVESDHGGEWDGRVTDFPAVADHMDPFHIYNATLVGPGGSSNTGEGAFEFSDDLGARFYNSIVSGFGSHAINIKSDANGLDQTADDGLPRIVVQNNIWYDFGSTDLVSDDRDNPTTAGATIFSDAANANTVEDPMFKAINFMDLGGDSVIDVASVIDPRPMADSPAFSNALAGTPDDSWFLPSEFQGAFGETNWLLGWTKLSEVSYLPEANESGASSAINISTLTEIQAGAGVVSGFIIEGDLPKAVLARAIGLQLAEDDSFFAGIAVEDPQLVINQIVDDVAVEIGTFDDWSAGDDADAISVISDYVGASEITNDDKSAAAYLVLNPGIYTVTATDNTGAGGWIQLEVYDADK
ncbi:hypothetical protein MLD52_16795 [Puniceicoccaceae bacterium K14]|nr:hypothetical protein [Puniceicoccaceae bacterium K14]